MCSCVSCVVTSDQTARTVILAVGLQVLELEEPIGDGVEGGISHKLANGLVLDLNHAARHLTWIDKPDLLAEGDKVVLVQRAAKALAKQHRVLSCLLCQAPVAVHVAEVKLA